MEKGGVTNVDGSEEGGEFAKRYDQVVENVTHAVMSRDHGTFPENGDKCIVGFSWHISTERHN